MKKIAIFLVSVVLAQTVWADNSTAITQNIQAVCFSPSKEGHYWTGEEKLKGEFSSPIRVVMKAGISAEATFTQGEWQGVQQVLKEHQAGDNASYRHCVETLTPLFIKNFNPPAKSSVQTKPVHKTKTNTKKSESASSIHIETQGEKSPAIVGDHATVNY